MQLHMWRAVATVLVAMIIGCANSPYRIAQLTAEELVAVPTPKLVRSCANPHYKSDAAIRELERRKDIDISDARRCPELLHEFARRGMVRERFIDSIANRKVALGMTTDEMQLSWGEPKESNRSVGSWGVHTQHVYGDFGPYIYTENGIVTSWQD